MRNRRRLRIPLIPNWVLRILHNLCLARTLTRVAALRNPRTWSIPLIPNWALRILARIRNPSIRAIVSLTRVLWRWVPLIRVRVLVPRVVGLEVRMIRVWMGILGLRIPLIRLVGLYRLTEFRSLRNRIPLVRGRGRGMGRVSMALEAPPLVRVFEGPGIGRRRRMSRVGLVVGSSEGGEGPWRWKSEG